MAPHAGFPRLGPGGATVIGGCHVQIATRRIASWGFVAPKRAQQTTAIQSDHRGLIVIPSAAQILRDGRVIAPLDAAVLGPHDEGCNRVVGVLIASAFLTSEGKE